MPKNKKSHPLIRLWGYARAHHREMVLAVLCSILNKLFDLAPPILIGMAVDVVVRQQDSFLAQMGCHGEDQLAVLALLTLFIWGMESLFEYFFRILWRNLAQTLQHKLRIDAYDHVQHLNMSYFEERNTGGLMAILNDDINQLERFLDEGINNIIQLIVTIVVIGGIYMYIAPGIGWLAILPMPFIIWGSIYSSAPHAALCRVREQVGLLNSQLSNNLGGIATIKSFTAEPYELARITAESETYRQRNRDAIELSSAFVPVIRMLICGLRGHPLLRRRDGAQRADRNRRLQHSHLHDPAPALAVDQPGQHPRSLSTGHGLDPAGLRPARCRRTAPRWRTGPRPKKVTVLSASKMSATNTERENQAVIRDLSLDIPAGHTGGIVGSTGAGKSTLVKLLLRFYDVAEGGIRLDGRTSANCGSRLRRSIGFVSQDVYLFHGTVRDNIAYGTSTPRRADRRRRQDREAHDFI